MIIFGYQALEEKEILEIHTSKNEIWNKNDICQKVFSNISNGVYIHALWNKIYKNSLIKNIQMDTNYVVSEDMDFNIKCFKKANKVKTIDYIGYNYNIVKYRTKYRRGMIESHIKISEELLNYFRNLKDNEKIVSKFLYNSLFYDLLAITGYNKMKINEKFKWYNYIKRQKIFNRLQDKEFLTSKKKTMYKIFFKSNILAYFAIKLYCKLERN